MLDLLADEGPPPKGRFASDCKDIAEAIEKALVARHKAGMRRPTFHMVVRAIGAEYGDRPNLPGFSTVTRHLKTSSVAWRELWDEGGDPR